MTESASSASASVPSASAHSASTPVVPDARTHVVDEAPLAGHHDRRLLAARITRWLSAGLLVLLVVGAGVLLASTIVDDLRIDADRGTATALVTEVSPRRAAIAFDTDAGRHVRPETGVFYPTGLVEGQRIQVEYRRANPALVRVSGRSWTVAVWPITSVVLFAGIPLAGVYLGTSRYVHRRSQTVTKD